MQIFWEVQVKGAERMTDKTETSAPQSSRGARFVEGLIKICREDKAAAASFRRASSKTLEYQCWPALVRLGVDIEKDSERAAFSCIGSALAAGRVEVNGSAPLSKALVVSYPPDSSQPQSKLLRLLACGSVEECCQVLRPLIKLVQSRAKTTIDYAGLLDDLLRFRFAPERIKAKWTADFVGGERK